MLSEQTRQSLGPAILTLRVIVLALAGGVLMFGVVAAVNNADKPLNVGGDVQYVFLLLTAILLAAGIVAPMFMPKAAGPGGSGAITRGTGAEQSTEIADAQRAFAAIQTSTIVRCAIFEGAAFLNLVWYLMRAELIHAAIAGLCWVCILAQLPFSERVAENIERRLRH